MVNSTTVLQSLYKNADMGVTSIDYLLERRPSPVFEEALRNQQREYKRIRSQTGRMLRKQQCLPRGISPYAKWSSKMMIQVQVAPRDCSKMAEMMMKGSLMGIVEAHRRLREYPGQNEQITALCQKLLQTEENNLQQMERFL